MQSNQRRQKLSLSCLLSKTSYRKRISSFGKLRDNLNLDLLRLILLIIPKPKRMTQVETILCIMASIS